jgi:heat-inducible transcriptional repressor
VGRKLPLSARLARILAAVVDEHVETARPVSSTAVLGRLKIDASSATIRNEMARLESLGYLSQPHTSAGRIPTDLGYRAYVDQLTRSEEFPEGSVQGIERVAHALVGGPEELLRRACRLLSRTVRCPAIALAPRDETPSLSHVQASQVAPNTILLVYVTSDGTVHHRVMPTRETVSPAQLSRLSEVLNRMLKGVKVSALSRLEMDEIRRNMAGMVVPHEAFRLILETARVEEADQVYVDGAIYMLEAPEFAAAEQLRPVMGALERDDLLRQALEAVEPAEAVWVRIGHEQPLAQLRCCSVVATHYCTEQGLIGTLAILGPTRLNYVEALPAVRLMASQLAADLSRRS